MGVLIQLHQVSVYRPRLFPLFQDDYPHFVPHPLRELLKKSFHAADSEIVDPASDDLVELGKRHIQWARHRVLPSEPFPNLGVQLFLSILCRLAFPTVLASPECNSQKRALGWPHYLGFLCTDL